jgi:alpha-tubulin suppressor-like RCC1 family protein
MAGPGLLSGGSGRRIATVLPGLAVMAGLLVTTAGTASAKGTSKPKVTSFTASPSSVTTADGAVTLSATVTNASGCTLTSSLPISDLPYTTSCSGGPVTRSIVVPLNSGKKAIKYKFTLTATGTGGTKSKKLKVSVAAGAGNPPLSGVASVVSTGETSASGGNDQSYCALLSSGGGVDCWGSNGFGQLGDGSTGPESCGDPCSTTPVPVSGVNGIGTLSGVESLVASGGGSIGGEGEEASFCALLNSGDVDCWGDNIEGELGIGSNSGPQTCPPASTPCSTTPVAAEVTGATSLESDGVYGYCAVLASTVEDPNGSVDCWGYGDDGELGNGTHNYYDATPGPVVAVGGDGILSGVASLAAGVEGYGYCAVLTSGGVDCWGLDYYGQVGNGSTSDSDVLAPVAASGVGGTGTLSDVKSVVGVNEASYCALLDLGSVDCWGAQGALGAGDSPSGLTTCTATDAACVPYPVQVLGVGGTGTLSDVSSLIANTNGSEDFSDVCASLGSGGVDCWGNNTDGSLGSGGNGNATPSNIPVAVSAVGGSGDLSGVSSLGSTDFGFCAALQTSGQVDCWGDDSFDTLGAGPAADCAPYDFCSTPQAVVGIGDSGNLSGVETVTGSELTNCALLTSGEVDCWGDGSYGQLGNGTGYEATEAPSPVSVFAPA